MPMRLLQWILWPISCVILLISFLVLILPISILVLPFSQHTRLHVTERFWGVFGRIAIHIACLARVYKQDLRDQESKSTGVPKGLYIANHSSFMDIPLLMTCFRIPPIMKKEVLYIPIFGLCGYASGAVVVDRSSSNSRKKVLEVAQARLVGKDGCLQYYPEGTRQRNSSRPKDYNEIKKPLMKFAYEAKIPVYSVSIFGTRHILSKKGMINYGKKLGLILHPATNPQDFPDMESFMQECWRKVTDGYLELEVKLS